MRDHGPEHFVVEVKEEYRAARARFLLPGDRGYTNNLENAGAYDWHMADFLATSMAGQAQVREFVREKKEAGKAFDGEPIFDWVRTLI